MSSPTDTVRVAIPLTIRRRNGRPRVLPPEKVADDRKVRAQDLHILRALGRAWAWRRNRARGEMATVGDIAKIEGVTDRFVSRTMRLAYLSPDVLERLVVGREPPSESVNQLIEATNLPWTEGTGRVFDTIFSNLR
jgi:hypothetical protein